MFICKKCNEEISNAKMVGLIIGQVGRETALKKGISPEAKGDIIAGIVSGLKIKCPPCDSNNWSYR